MKMKRLICACLALVMLLAMSALADTYVSVKNLKPGDGLYVLDRADVLSDDTEGEIIFSGDLLDEACGAQIVVVTVETTGSESIDDYTTDLFNTWGIGDAKKGNGFLLLLAIGDDDYYAVCGDGLQPKFTSGALKDYFDKYLETDFAAGRYDAGVKKFFEAVFKRVADTYNAEVTVADGIAAYEASETGTLTGTARFGGGSLNRSYSETHDTGGGFMMGLVVIIILIVVLSSVSRRRRARRGVFVSPPPPTVGQGGYRGVNGAPGAGGYRGPTPTPRRTSNEDAFMRGLFYGMLRSGGSSYRSGGSRTSRPSGGGFRSSGGSSFRSSGSSRSFGGGHSSGGGAGRGRH